MGSVVDFEVVVIKGIVFHRNEHGYLLFDGRPLGALKWGHPALVAAMGDHFRSFEAWDRWFQTEFKNID